MEEHKQAPMPALDENFWNKRWETEETAWDLGSAAPAIVAYMQQVKDKDIAILIPGCGNAHEAKALLELGFTNITLVDIAPLAVARLQAAFGDQQGIHIHHQDFFKLEPASFDLMLEQTFFCAINPALRPAYAQQAAAILKPGGKLVGLLFDTEFERQGPPFGGHKAEYVPVFEPYFDLQTLETCTNSVKPRAGNELFMILKKKAHA